MSAVVRGGATKVGCMDKASLGGGGGATGAAGAALPAAIFCSSRRTQAFTKGAPTD